MTDEQDGVYRCRFCDNPFDNSTWLGIHEASAHINGGSDMGQALTGNVNPKWAADHNARYAERISQTTGVDPEKLRQAAEQAKHQASKR